MDAERGRKLTERLFESDGVEPGAASRVVPAAASGVVPGAGSGVEQGVGSNSNSKLLLLALAVGLVLVASAGVGREVVNARALTTQVEEADAARAEASHQADLARAAESRLQHRQENILQGVADAWASGDYSNALLFTKAAVQDDPELRDELFRLSVDALFDGDAEQARKSLVDGKGE